jgi:preprotein translocase subunit SecA
MPAEWRERKILTRESAEEELERHALAAYESKEQQVSPKLMREIERFAMLRVIDERWRAHLYEMDQMKEGINLRAYGQKDPLLEYKSEGFRMFKEMLGMIDEQVVELIFKAQLAEPPPVRRRMPAQMTTMHQSSEGLGFLSQRSGASAPPPPPGKPQPVVIGHKVGRNDPCPCGSGKKYKKCHGALE